MFAQDTGGAIVGPARADIYYGSGEPAGTISGRFKQPGQFTMLFPKSVDPLAADRDDDEEIPLPRPRPANIPQDEMAAVKPEVVVAAAAAAVANVPLPVARPEVKKPEATKTASVKPEAKPEPKAAETPKLAAKKEARAEKRNQEARQAGRARAARLVRDEQATARSRRTLTLEARHARDCPAVQTPLRRGGRERASSSAAQASRQGQSQAGCRRAARHTACAQVGTGAARPQGEAPPVP